jgi:hypothetical protein
MFSTSQVISIVLVPVSILMLWRLARRPTPPEATVARRKRAAA